MIAYYNEHDPYAAAWLRNLMRAGHIMDGEVDERSIVDVQAEDLRGFTQVHLFAGIGGWSLAARLAGWTDLTSFWSGSCPCQPFSSAGKRQGSKDERHLWPEMFRLVKECRPAVVVGEQVASQDGRAWLAGVFADLEGLAYAVAGADLCAAGVGAPHIRQRLWWVANADGHGCDSPTRSGDEDGERDAESCRRVAHAVRERRRVRLTRREDAAHASRAGEDVWRGIYVGCADGKARRIKPGLEPLAHGIPNRVGRLRAYGNAISPEVAAQFLLACTDALRECAP